MIRYKLLQIVFEKQTINSFLIVVIN
jgi:hypothetical protein